MESWQIALAVVLVLLVVYLMSGSEHASSCCATSLMDPANQQLKYASCLLGGPSNCSEYAVGQLSNRIIRARAKCGVKPDPANVGAFMHWNLCMRCADPVFSTNPRNQAQCVHSRGGI